MANVSYSALYGRVWLCDGLPITASPAKFHPGSPAFPAFADVGITYFKDNLHSFRREEVSVQELWRFLDLYGRPWPRTQY